MDRPLWIAVDFDGTLCEHKFPEIGKPKMEVLAWVRMQQARGAFIFLWTCRNHAEERDYLQEAIDWCAGWGIEFNAINDNPYCGFYSRKIVADIYLDDRGITPETIILLGSHNIGGF